MTWRERLRFWEHPPGPVFHALLVPLGLALLWNASLPGDDFLLIMVVTFLVVLAAVVWAVRVLAFIATRRRFSWWLVVAPVAGLVVLSLDVTNLPLRARFQLSRTAFDRSATASSPETEARQRIGLYTIQWVSDEDDQILYSEVHGCDMLCDAGFLYAPHGARADAGMTVSHLTGPWYTYVDEG